jgi:hypothetical protein
MRTHATSLAPGEPAYDVTVYIVLDDFGLKLGRAYRETDEAEADEKAVIKNMLTGQYSCPVRVVAFNTVEGWARDVSEDIAREVLTRARQEQETLTAGVRDFIEGQTGETVEEELCRL